MNRYTQFFASGRWQTCSGAELLAIVNPSSQAQVGVVRLCSTADGEAAVRAAGLAFRVWSQSNPVQRKDALHRLAQAVEVREQSFVASFALEAGCPVFAGRLVQGQMPRQAFAATLAGLDQVQWRQTLGHSLVVCEPVGVVLGIGARSAPLHQMVAKTTAAIAAGCSIVLKPSEATPGTVRLFAEAVEEADLPPGLVNVLLGGPELGAELAANPGVDLISFSGSRSVGQEVAALAAVGTRRTVLELGGKSAAVVLDDADLQSALAQVLHSCMGNSGPACSAQTRLIVPRSRLAEVTQTLRTLLSECVLGAPQDDATRVGPLPSAEQFERANTLIAEALSEGAELIAGGPGRAPGFETGHYIAPTVLRVTPEMSIAHEELLGPVLCVLVHDGDGDAVRIANATPYGLSGAVWSANPARAQALALRMRAGQVLLNGAPPDPAAPFGGFGASGHGRENGRFGIEAMLDYKSIPGGSTSPV